MSPQCKFGIAGYGRLRNQSGLSGQFETVERCISSCLQGDPLRRCSHPSPAHVPRPSTYHAASLPVTAILWPISLRAPVPFRTSLLDGPVIYWHGLTAQRQPG